MSVTIQLRRDTAANWATNNPTLAAGEIGYETDTSRAKMGTGTTAWSSLSYWDTMGSSPRWFSVIAYGADSTGTADSTTAIAAAITAAVNAGGGIVYFPAGKYKVSSTLTIGIAGVYLMGAGLDLSFINYTGSGDCVRMYSTSQYTSGWGGGILGLIIDGTSASAGACGAHIGDIYQLQFNFGVRYFQGTGSKGMWFDNQYYWCEDMSGRIFVEQNTSNIIFDNSANLTGSSTGSFARTMLTIVLDGKGVGNGLTVQNGAQIYGSTINYVGNMDYNYHTGTKYWAINVLAPAGFSYTATNASPAVFTATGHYYGNGTAVFLTGGTAPTGFTNGTAYYVVNTNITAGTFQLSATSGGTAINSTSTGSGTVNTFQASTIRRSILNVNIECNATTGVQPGTINFSSSTATNGYNSINGCTGIIDFTGNNAFATANNSYGNFYFEGMVYGDSFLWRSMGLGTYYYANGSLSTGGTIYTTGVLLSRVNTSSNITGMIMGNGPASDTQMLTVENNGTGSITFAASGTSHVRNGTACVIPPYTCMMFQWDYNQFAWYALGGAVAIDTTATDIQPAGVQAAGSNGLAADSGHVHPNYADLSIYLAPSGATAETFPRTYTNLYSSALVSGTVYATAIGLPAGLVVNNLGMLFGSTSFATVTHGWFALLSSAMVVRAVTADQTTSFQSGSTNVKLAVGAAYTIPTAGLYYLAFCAVAGTMGNMFINSMDGLTAANATVPILSGTSSTGQTTPPSTGTTLSAITAVNSVRLYGYTA